MTFRSPAIAPFCISEPDKWKLYELQFTNFLVAEGITEEDRKRACFLAHCGLPTLELAVNLLLPLADILQTLRAHFKATTSIFPACLAFHRQNQRPDESVADYAAVLRLAAAPYQWKDLEEALRDDLLLGLKDKSVQRHLLMRNTLSFAEVLNEALASEAAD